MRVKKNKSELDWHSPKQSLVIGSISNEKLRGFGIGFSYFADGNIDFGFVIGGNYYNIEVMWGRAEELSYYEEEQEAEFELEQYLEELFLEEQKKQNT